jgi:hypothetical protein
MKIDVFTHVLPNKYKEELFRVAPKDMDIVSNVRSTPTVYDLITDRLLPFPHLVSKSSPMRQEVLTWQS